MPVGHDRVVLFGGMTQADVLAFLDVVDELNIGVWIDGSWSRYASTGEQFDRHSDLDIVIEAKDLRMLVHRLGHSDFVPMGQVADQPWSMTLVDNHGRMVDLHYIEFDENGTPWMSPDERYPAEALTGVGLIGERPVRCIRPGLVGGRY